MTNVVPISSGVPLEVVNPVGGDLDVTVLNTSFDVNVTNVSIPVVSSAPLEVVNAPGDELDVNVTNVVPISSGVPLEVINPVGGDLDVTVLNTSFDVNVTNASIPITTSTPLEVFTSSNTPLQIAGNMDAFYRMRISEPLTIFDSKQLVDSQPLFWDDAQTSGAGTSSTYNTNQASTSISVSASTAGTRVRQTFRYFNYQPGKSQLVIMTGIFGSVLAGITSRLGLFTANNGMFFEQSPLGMGVVVRSFTSGVAVDTRINQANWNLDTMDGTGPSGITLDFTKTLIYIIDYEWLGVGTIRYGVYVNGLPYYVHAVHNSNINTVVYMSTPNLPLRYEISNDGTGLASSLTHICTTVITEGGRQQTGLEREE